MSKMNAISILTIEKWGQSELRKERKGDMNQHVCKSKGGQLLSTGGRCNLYMMIKCRNIKQETQTQQNIPAEIPKRMMNTFKD